MNYREFYERRHELLFKKEYARAPRYAKIITHRLTPPLVFLFHRLGWSPNQATLLSLFAGLASCVFFMIPSPAWLLAGALLLEFYYVLDSVDGQLARVSGKFSKTGAFFDVLGNYLVHPLVFAAMGLGQYYATENIWPLVFGIMAGFAYLWMGVVWDVRAHVILQALLKKGVAARPFEFAAHGTARIGVFKRSFSFLHKISTYPTVMNMITLVAVAQFISSEAGFFSGLLYFYGVLIPFVSISRMAKMILARDVDTEYESLAGESHGS